MHIKTDIAMNKVVSCYFLINKVKYVQPDKNELALHNLDWNTDKYMSFSLFHYISLGSTCILIIDG